MYDISTFEIQFAVMFQTKLVSEVVRDDFTGLLEIRM